MSRRIWGLLRDITPLWILVTLAILVTLTGMDAVWFDHPSSWAGSMWLCGAVWAFMPTIHFLSRFKVWRTLPVSRADRLRARWWACLGLPLACITVAMAATLLAQAAFGDPAPARLDVAEALSIQFVAATLMVAIFGGASLLHRRWRHGVGALIGLVLLGLLLTGGASVRLDDPVIVFAMAAVALVLTAAAYVAAGRPGDVLNGFPSDRSHGLGGGAALGAMQARAARPGPKGWLAILPFALQILAIAGAVGVGARYWPSIAPGHAAGATSDSVANRVVIMVLVLWALGGTAAVRSVRILRALPMGAWALTAVLQGLMLAVVAVVCAGLWAAFELSGGDMSWLRLFACVLVPLMALRLPLDFRFGAQWYLALIFVPIALAFLFSLVPNSVWPQMMGVGLVLTVLFWGWTWWELARGRTAYRMRPVRPLRWRGA